jgi:hypothetical protein
MDDVVGAHQSRRDTPGFRWMNTRFGLPHSVQPNRVSRRPLSFVSVDQAAWTKPRHDFGQAGIGDGEAALASTEHAGVADHFLIHIPGTMHHNRARERVAVRRIESLEAHRVTMGAHIERACFIGSGGGRIRVGLIREALEPSRMRRVGTPAMSNPMRPHAAISKVHQVKPRCTRRKGEVSDADKVLVADTVAVSLQRIERTSKQTRGYLAVDTVCSSEGEPSAGGPRSEAGNRKIDKKTAGNYQDIKLQHN